jgi:hypothetical protein
VLRIRDVLSRIPDPDPTIAPSWIPDPGGKKAPDPGSGSATLCGSVALPAGTSTYLHYIIQMPPKSSDAIGILRPRRHTGTGSVW